MNKYAGNIHPKIFGFILTILCLFYITASVNAQNFDFEQLEKKIRDYTVIVEIKIEFSFGMHTNEQEERQLGTIVSEDGLIMFNGTSLSSDATFSSFAGVTIKTTPTRIDIFSLEGDRYEGEFIGVDRFTKIGFVKILKAEKKFTPIKFKTEKKFQTGDWLALYMMLPEFITPPLAADVGMLSTIVKSPENFPLTVGFNALQVTSVLYDEDLQPVGVLGSLMDPSFATTDQSGLLESFNQFGIPLLGVITPDRLSKIIANPPQKGEIDRSWLGITLQALTSEIADFWNLTALGGIIVNDIVKNSPAEKAGLMVGDIIYEVNGLAVEIDKEEKISIFQRMISEMGPGTQIELSILRPMDNSFDTLMLLTTLEKAPIAATEAEEYENNSLEFKVRNMVFADYMIYQLEQQTFSGVVVTEIKPGGLAIIAGLTLGDIIQKINNVPVTSVDDIKNIMERIEQEKPEEIIFFVWRDNKTLFVNVKTDWR